MRIGDLPFSAAVASVGILAAVGVFSIVIEGGSAVWPVGLVPAALWAGIYLLSYHARPSAFRDPEEDDDDFDDPVAEAARGDTGTSTPSRSAAEDEAEDDRIARFESDSPAHPPPSPRRPG